MMPDVVCPIGRQDDQLQKVTSVMSSGSEALRKRLARPEVPARPEFILDPPPPKHWVGSDPARNRARLRGEPAGKFDDDLFEIRFLALFGVTLVLGLVIASGLFSVISAVFGANALDDLVGSLHLDAQTFTQSNVEFGFAVVVALAVVISWLSRYLRTRQAKYRLAQEQHQSWEQRGLAQYQALVSAWEANAHTVAAAQQLWTTQLYYCVRHDVVFLAGDARTASPEEMLSLLTSGTTMQVALRPVSALRATHEQRLPPGLEAARTLYDQERYEEARADLERFTQETPDSADAWALLSQALGELWRREKALAAAEKAVQLNPRAPVALTALARALNGDDRYSEGLIAAEQALSIDSQYIPALRSKAGALGLAKRTEAALSIIDEVLTCDPTNFDMLVAKTAALGDTDRWGEAIAVGQFALRVRPQSVVAHLLLASAYGLGGQNQAAQQLVSQMVALRPQDFLVYTALGAAYLAQGQFWQAVSAYNRALALNRESEPLRRQRNTALATALKHLVRSR